MSINKQPTCADCSGKMTPIQMIDHTVAADRDMVYTVPEAKRSFWTSNYPVEGKVHAFMCNSCGVIKLYGGPLD